MNLAYLSIGSNICPQDNLPRAVNMLENYGSIIISSSVWETIALGDMEQPNYLNASVILETRLTAKDLYDDGIKYIENILGRKKSNNPFASRTIDIDIMLFNDEIITLGHRRIPDKEILERAFVALCLAEISPNYIHPDTNQTLEQISQTFENSSKSMKLRPDIRLLKQGKPTNNYVYK